MSPGPCSVGHIIESFGTHAGNMRNCMESGHFDNMAKDPS